MGYSNRFMNIAGKAIFAAALVALPLSGLTTVKAEAQVAISATVAPPPIPDYEQPYAPGDGYIWTPGYWAWDNAAGDYYWVEGAWVLPPYSGALWTPGYWGPYGGGYGWCPGYWGTSIGYYGGINYGFGYFGVGFYGGYWNRGHFWYNSSVNRFRPGFGGHFYNGGFGGHNGFRPGGQSFAGNRGGFNGNRGSTINGNRGGFNGGNRGGFNNGQNNGNRGGFGQGNVNRAGFGQQGNS